MKVLTKGKNTVNQDEAWKVASYALLLSTIPGMREDATQRV